MRRSLVASGVAVLLAAIAWMADISPAAAQRLPGGSYLSSCRDVQVRRGRDLVAFCAMRNGAWISTRLNDFPSCRGDIANRNGQLWCARGPMPPPPGGPAPLPRGSYLRSCANAFVAPGGILRADCRRMNGSWNRAALNLNFCRGARDIGNANGQLVCR